MIAAGYPTEMERFLAGNPGYGFYASIGQSNSRTTAPEELLTIFETMAREGGYQLDPDARQRAEEIFALRLYLAWTLVRKRAVRPEPL